MIRAVPLLEMRTERCLDSYFKARRVVPCKTRLSRRNEYKYKSELDTYFKARRVVPYKTRLSRRNKYKYKSDIRWFLEKSTRILEELSSSYSITLT